MNKNRRIALYSMFLSFGLILQAIEAIYLPSIPIPGIKLGLANLVVLVMVIYFSPIEIISNIFIKILLVSLMFGSFLAPAFYFSLVGALMSYAIIFVLHRLFYPKISLIGLSVAGAVFHNIGQLIVAFIIVKTSAVFMQLPLLLFASVPTGLIIGISANYSIRRLSKIKELSDFIPNEASFNNIA